MNIGAVMHEYRAAGDREHTITHKYIAASNEQHQIAMYFTKFLLVYVMASDIYIVYQFVLYF